MRPHSDENHDVSDEKAARAARRALSRGEKWALRATILCGVLLLVAVPVLRHHNAIPNIVIPPPAPLPEPNAFDVYLQAGTMLIPAPPAAYKKDAPLSLLQSSAQNNAPALRVLRQGFAFSYRNPPARNPTALFPHFAKFREAARAFSFESQVLAARGDWNGAMNTKIDGVRFGSDIPRGGPLLSALVGISCQAIARADSSQTVSHLNAQQARAAAKRLESLYQNRASPAEAMQEEKWFVLANLKEVFATPNWREKPLNGCNVMGGGGVSPVTKMQFFLLDANTVAKNHIAVMDVHVANARLPYSAPKKPLPQNLDIYTALSELVFERDGFNFARNDAGNALLFTALALRAFQAEKGRLPQSLKELAPSYLSRVPVDPFGKGTDLRYVRKSNSAYLLYSVGPDGKDDDGKAPSKRSASSRRQFIDTDSRGDMVFGVNS